MSHFIIEQPRTNERILRFAATCSGARENSCAPLRVAAKPRYSGTTLYQSELRASPSLGTMATLKVNGVAVELMPLLRMRTLPSPRPIIRAPVWPLVGCHQVQLAA